MAFHIFVETHTNSGHGPDRAQILRVLGGFGAGRNLHSYHFCPRGWRTPPRGCPGVRPLQFGSPKILPSLDRGNFGGIQSHQRMMSLVAAGRRQKYILRFRLRSAIVKSSSRIIASGNIRCVPRMIAGDGIPTKTRKPGKSGTSGGSPEMGRSRTKPRRISVHKSGRLPDFTNWHFPGSRPGK